LGKARKVLYKTGKKWRDKGRIAERIRKKKIGCSTEAENTLEILIKDLIIYDLFGFDSEGWLKIKLFSGVLIQSLIFGVSNK